MRWVLAIVIVSIAWGTAAQAKRKTMSRPPISSEACAQIRSAVQTYGAALVEAGARERGYTATQIRYAKARCV